MKQWTVTYREKSGVKTSVVIEAEARAGVFAELKNRGINAISITEGAVKAKRKATGGVSKGVWGVVAAVVVVALVGVVWMMMEGEDEVVVKEVMPKARSVTKERNDENVKEPQPNKNETVAVQNSSNRTESATAKNLANVEALKNTNTNKVVYSVEDQIKESIKRGRRPIFKHQSDVWLAQFAEPGVCVPPIPMSITQDEFLATLKEPIKFDDSDTSEERFQKESVIAMREEAVQYIKNGGTYDSYMKELARRQQRESDLMSEARALIIDDFKAEGDIESTVGLLRAVNEKLEAEGLRKMKLPAPIKIRLVREGIKIPEV